MRYRIIQSSVGYYRAQFGLFGLFWLNIGIERSTIDRAKEEIKVHKGDVVYQE